MSIGRSRFVWVTILIVAALGVGLGAGYVLSRTLGTDAGSPGQGAAATSSAQRTVTGTGVGGASAASSGSGPAAATPRPSSSPRPAAPSAGLGTATATATPPATPSAPTPSGTPAGSAAPTSASKFDPRHTVVPMAFPLPATAQYTYGPLWRTPRLGIVYPYNQIRGVSKGVFLRAHDGVDLEVAIGTPVMAPFGGVIVNPAALWKPWDPERYGNVVIVRSSEPTSRGYYAILVHLSSKSVKVGAKVARGQVVGRTGITGNAAGTIPHLHFELRAPFQIVFHYGGVARALDDFDPLPSLQAADPHLQ